MLVLERKPGQRIRIGDAWLTVLGFRSGRVVLGFDAPLAVVIEREELIAKEDGLYAFNGERYERVTNESAKAAGSS